MDQNKVMKLWTAIVTAFLALCTALGLVSASAATANAAPRTESPRTETASRTVPTIPAPRHWSWPSSRALPPTMKQRIRAEAHGKSPSCRRRPLDEDQSPLEIRETQKTRETQQTEQRTVARQPSAPLDC
ncbi:MULTISPECIES: DUF6344 domain-containing protein [Streptomyces]|uniref:Secreted protein n=1 Tax=Streptomyces misionensis TaxID=67331 RepID=A0A1H4YJF4_9ACTN|nr:MULTISPECIES: DUF6344 domain-containing protein [Streptomyces]SED17340.1 hypothetical protein SAMN04490357_4029 [Streptomyces misionensis]SFY53478.1 hypothetical protein STEPF1_06760 [Streptomyces sp. F-1]